MYRTTATNYALSGLGVHAAPNPGRCPGLTNGCPCGALVAQVRPRPGQVGMEAWAQCGADQRFAILRTEMETRGAAGPLCMVAKQLLSLRERLSDGMR